MLYGIETVIHLYGAY